MNWITTLLSSAGKLHVSSDVTKVMAILAGLAFGVFGHDWATGGEIAIGGLGVSLAASAQARKVTNSIAIDPNATANIPKP